MLSGTRLEGAPPGADQPPLQEQPRRHVHGRDREGRPRRARAGRRRSPSATTTTTASTTSSSPTTARTCSTATTATARSRDVTEKAGLRQDAVRYGSGCTWVDYDRDGHLDLFVANYLDTTLEKLPKPGENADCHWKGVPVNCGPRGLPTGFVQLFHNNGDGTFTDVSRQSGRRRRRRRSYPMTAVAADFDNDGWPDIYVACDSTPSLLFRNKHDGTFREEGLERGVALSEDGMEQAGMGVGVGDYDLDGNLDIFKTHFADDTNVLYRNDGKGNFDDVTIRAGLGVETRYVGWGAGMVDLDNDGFPDLFVVTGSVYPEVERKLPAYPFRTPRLVFRNLGDGRFEELIEEAGPGRRGGALQPGLRLRRLRQRRRRRRPDR